MINRTSIIKQPDKISFFNDVYKLQKEYQDALKKKYEKQSGTEGQGYFD